MARRWKKECFKFAR